VTVSTRATTDVFAERTTAIAALADALGWALTSSRLISRDAIGDSFVTGHVLDITNPDGTALQRTVYLDTGSLDREGTVPVPDGSGGLYCAWLYPSDPALPELAPSVYAESATELLAGLGLETGAVVPTVVTYRPGKRAVVRVDTALGRTLFLKVVRPQRVEEVVRRHRAWLAGGIPVPEVLTWTPDGLVVLAALPGREAIGFLEQLDVAALTDELARVTKRIADLDSTEPARVSLATRLDFYFDGMTRLAPSQKDRIASLCHDIEGMLADGGTPPAGVTVHGDLHLGQLFADPALPHQITGVLDIDTAGIGDPADDAAAVVAHLIATAALQERRGEEERAFIARALADDLKTRWTWPEDPGFRSRASAIAATHLLGHSLAGSLEPLDALSAARAMLERAPRHV
jgi:aminoglycoside phosphotransferase